jgi:hypothetical protein
MLIEIAMLLMVTTSCDVSKAALGLCQIDCSITGAGSFTVCANQGQSNQTGGSSNGSSPAKATPKPQRLCKYYVNGTIDVPTIGTITAWVDVGSRPCIGDSIPEPKVTSSPKSIQSQLEEQFTAVSKTPFAWWEPGSDLEIEEPAIFHVQANSTIEAGELLGQTAQIRFRPVSYSWIFSDGISSSGVKYSRIFLEIGNYRATARVDYEVDYRFDTGPWIQNAASWSLSSNELFVVVIDPPRRTLLVG